MFGNDSKPTIVYKYDIAQGKKEAPFDDSNISEQLFAANRYQHAVLEAQLKGRKTYRQKRLERYPAYDNLETDLRAADDLCNALQGQIKARNAQEKRKRCTPQERAELDQAKLRRKELSTQLKELRARITEEDQGQPEGDKLSDFAQQTVATAMLEADKLKDDLGLYQATARQIDQAVIQSCRSSQTDPFHMKWDGAGTLWLQLQAQKDRPKATYANIALGQRATELQVRQQGKYHVFSVRIGSKGKGNRIPIWADCPVVLHRPFPADAHIKWVQLTRKRQGRGHQPPQPNDTYKKRRYEYALCFQLAREDWTPEDLATTGSVAVNASWRKVPTGIRALYWLGSDGAKGELIIPQDQVTYINKAEELQSLRDDLFNAIMVKLAIYLSSLSPVPDWAKEIAPHLSKIRSKDRILDLLDQWQRHQDDEVIWALLEEWRRAEIHLERWESNERAKYLRWRKDFYNTFWAKIRRKYAEVICDDTSYADLKKHKEADDNTDDTAMRINYNLVSPSQLLGKRKTKEGETFCGKIPATFVSAKYLTATCHQCGQLCEWDAAKHLIHTCEHCGATWDQDYNHCVNARATVVASGDEAISA